jgi:hypothetical protein
LLSIKMLLGLKKGNYYRTKTEFGEGKVSLSVLEFVALLFLQPRC